MRFYLPISAVALVALATPACSNTIGPVVRDIRSDGAGRLYIQTCNLEFANRAGSGKMVDCRTKVVDVTASPFPRSS